MEVVSHPRLSILKELSRILACLKVCKWIILFVFDSNISQQKFWIKSYIQQNIPKSSHYTKSLLILWNSSNFYRIAHCHPYLPLENSYPSPSPWTVLFLFLILFKPIPYQKQKDVCDANLNSFFLNPRWCYIDFISVKGKEIEIILTT